jgi:protein-L-isoaspartate(D-aspartate) O-methyltransferase
VDEHQYEKLRRQMVDEQLRKRGIAEERVLAAIGRVPRHEFVPSDSHRQAYADQPLGIGLGQTISQPYMVARMTELLRPGPESRVLEVGTGSGYQAAVLGELAAQVFTIERHEPLAEQARAVLRRLGYDNVQVVVGDGSLGLPADAPFDGILVAAAAPDVPRTLEEQLAVGGRLVVPVGDSYQQTLVVSTRTRSGFRRRDILECRFVPLVGEEGYRAP